MKANELMIDDWVLSKSISKPCKVVGIDPREGLGQNGYTFKLKSQDNVMLFVHAVSVEPILLTKEILEENGFKEVHGFGYFDKYPTLGWGYHNGIHDYCSIDVTFYDTPINGVSHLVKINRNSASGDGINSVHNCDIDYVHQLQHAIRQCGIDKEIVIEKEITL